MQTITEAMVREAFNIPKEMQLCNKETEAQWECFRKLHSSSRRESKQCLYMKQ